MKKRVLALLTAAVAAGLTACSGAGQAVEEKEISEETVSAGDDAVSGEKTVLNFYEHADNEAIAKMQVEAYNAMQSDVEVRLSIIANDDYDDKIKIMLSGGADIDVFWIRSGDQARQMAGGGAVLALDELMEKNGVDYTDYGDMGEQFFYDGQTYGLPANQTCWLLFYNKTLFDEAGLEYPTDLTWDAYAQLCKELTTDETQGGLLVNWIMNIGSVAAGEYLTDRELERTKEYVQFLNRVYNEDQSNMSLEEMSGSFDVNSVFAEGNTYMMINGDWTFQLFPDYAPGFEWAAAPLPHFEDVPVGSSIGTAPAYGINAKSEKTEAAFDFIRFCNYSDEGAVIYAKNASVPCYPSEEALEVYRQSVTIPGTEYVFSASVRGQDGVEENYSEIKQAYVEEITEYLIGNCEIDTAFGNYKQRRNEISAK
ncbi:MAG: extracellular solute-binding protein [Eubacteriales bacterium]|nr:extracellular solute-binding protein [Eubacteriales bacterium]